MTSNARAQVLCVDDNEDECDLVIEVLNEFDVTCVPTIAAARRRLENHRYALIVLDEHLPDGSGLSFCSELGRSGIGTPVIIISGDSFLTCSAADTAGARTFIAKSTPSYIDDLHQAAQQFAHSASAGR